MKKLNINNLLCIFIILLPILDVVSFLFRNYFNTSFSPSTFLRPIIPTVAFVYIFFKKNFKTKTILVCMLYGLYAVLHLFAFNKLHYSISYGTLTHELQYLINYSFAIMSLFVFLLIFKDNDTSNLKLSVLIANEIYISLLFISIITSSSSTTYLEGIGLKGWFESGNSLSAILVLNLFVICPFLSSNNSKKIRLVALIEILLVGIFLTIFLGTRTGLFGFIIAIGLYIFSKIFIVFRNNFVKNTLTLKNKIIYISCILLVILIVALIFLKGNSILSRRKYLASLNNQTIDPSTGEVSHVTGDILDFKNKIDNNLLDDTFLSKEAKQSILDLYYTANKFNISCTNRRAQQLIFNAYLVKNQANLFYILFGNGFLNNYAELTLEMEIPALLLNFGLVGFTLYFIPFFALFVYGLYFGIKNIKKINEHYIFWLSGILLGFVLSFLIGQIFFNSTVMIIMAYMNVLLFNEIKKIKSKDEPTTELLPEKVLIYK